MTRRSPLLSGSRTAASERSPGSTSRRALDKLEQVLPARLRVGSRARQRPPVEARPERRSRRPDRPPRHQGRERCATIGRGTGPRHGDRSSERARRGRAALVPRGVGRGSRDWRIPCDRMRDPWPTGRPVADSRFLGDDPRLNQEPSSGMAPTYTSGHAEARSNVSGPRGTTRPSRSKPGARGPDRGRHADGGRR